MRKPNTVLLCLDTATGVIRRYQRSEFSHVSGVKPPLLDSLCQVPAEWIGQLGRADVWPMIERFRLTGEVNA